MILNLKYADGYEEKSFELTKNQIQIILNLFANLIKNICFMNASSLLLQKK
jgi:hypothetical protein